MRRAVNGMLLQYTSYFCPGEARIEDLAAFILSTKKSDGGYSWDEQSITSVHHTTICVLEGSHEYIRAGYKDLLKRMQDSEKSAREWLLSNNLFMSADKRYQKLSHPYRYRYGILRVLEYFAKEKIPYDKRIDPAFTWLGKKQQPSGFSHLENIHKGNMHFPLEEKGKPIRFITLKALFIKKVYEEFFIYKCSNRKHEKRRKTSRFPAPLIFVSFNYE